MGTDRGVDMGTYNLSTIQRMVDRLYVPMSTPLSVPMSTPLSHFQLQSEQSTKFLRKMSLDCDCVPLLTPSVNSA